MKSPTFEGNIGEEIGWKGHLLPKLQANYRIIAVALILSFFNSLWHLRSDCVILILQYDFAGFSLIYFPDMGLRMMITIPVVMVMIFLFNETKGSLLIMILFHGAANASWEWVKEVTASNNPDFLLPVLQVCYGLLPFILCRPSSRRHETRK